MIRPAAVTDVEVLVALMGRLHEESPEEGQAPFDAAAARRAMLGLLCDPALGRVWLVADGETAVGYLALTFGYSLEYGGRDAAVDEFFIAPTHRGRGWGERVLRAVTAAADGLGVRALHLEVKRANADAGRLYRRCGFVVHDRTLMTRPGPG